jgi:methionyl-tRNA formyltransferase
MGDTVKTYILLTDKEWHDQLFDHLNGMSDAKWHRIRYKKDFTAEKLGVIKPDQIFIPHWSYIIPAAIYDAYECIVFHMTDLPVGRGGSPLQNLIVRGFKETKITAIKVAKGIDTGDIYLKKELDLGGTAHQIFVRSAVIIEQMIREIIQDQPIPVSQKGDIIEFKRRTPADSDLSSISSLNKVYDHIRMLDCDGYPLAFIETQGLRLEFKDAVFIDGKLEANVRITEK